MNCGKILLARFTGVRRPIGKDRPLNAIRRRPDDANTDQIVCSVVSGTIESSDGLDKRSCATIICIISQQNWIYFQVILVCFLLCFGSVIGLDEHLN